jgi:phosphatidate cytidylyltransferase
VLKHRLITGPVLIALLLGIVLLDQWLDTARVGSNSLVGQLTESDRLPPGMAMLGLAIVFGMLGAVEFTRIIRANGFIARAGVTAAAAMVGLLMCYVAPAPALRGLAAPLMLSGFAFVLVMCLLCFSAGRNVHGVLAATGAVLYAMVYLGVLMGFLLLLRWQHSPWWIVGVVMTTKMCDTGAFFTGTAIGRHKLIPWLSPGKTWEGLVGGVITSGLVGMLLGWFSTMWLDEANHVQPLYGLVCGIGFGFVGQFGDLCMSLLKRGAGLKDSSSILPGIGGVLDVLDSPLMVAPVAFWMLGG